MRILAITVDASSASENLVFISMILLLCNEFEFLFILLILIEKIGLNSLNYLRTISDKLETNPKNYSNIARFLIIRYDF